MDSENLELFMEKFGTFFEEFKDDNITSYIFYVIFVFRRLTTVALILFIEEPIVQLSLSFVLSLGVISN